MHLDCVFSVLSETCCIMLEDIMGENSPMRRLVDEYVREGAGKPYKLARCRGRRAGGRGQLLGSAWGGVP